MVFCGSGFEPSSCRKRNKKKFHFFDFALALSALLSEILPFAYLTNLWVCRIIPPCPVRLKRHWKNCQRRLAVAGTATDPAINLSLRHVQLAALAAGQGKL